MTPNNIRKIQAQFYRPPRYPRRRVPQPLYANNNTSENVTVNQINALLRRLSQNP